MPGTLVVIPAYNEADSIERVVKRAQRFADVCVVDDASRDATASIVAGIPGAALVRHERNTHIPGALKDGMRYALERGYERVITMDAGDSHDPAEIPGFEAHRDADLVLSHRVKSEGTPAWRRVLSRSGTWAMNRALAGPRLLGPSFRDCTSGYRLYSRRAAEVVVRDAVRSRSFDFHLEALAVVYRAGLRIEERPIAYRFTNSSLRLRVVGHALGTALRIWTGR